MYLCLSTAEVTELCFGIHHLSETACCHVLPLGELHQSRLTMLAKLQRNKSLWSDYDTTDCFSLWGNRPFTASSPLPSHLATAETHKQESIFCPCQCRETERKRVASPLQRLRAMTTILAVNETHSEVISQQKINRKEKWGDGEREKRRE